MTVRATLVIGMLAACGPAACGTSTDTPGARPPAVTTAAPTLAPVALPNLSAADPALRDRIVAQHGALVALQRQPSIRPDDLGRSFGEAGKLLMAGEFIDAAEPYLLNAQTLLPRDPAWPYYLAHAARLRNAPDTAIARFTQARALAPNDVPTLVWLGRLYADAGRDEDARQVLGRAVTLAPRAAAALYELGRVELAAGDVAAAITHLEAALATDPAAAKVHYTLAAAYRSRGDAARAAAELRQWRDIDLQPADPLMDEIGALLRTAIADEIRGTRALDRRDWAEAVARFRSALTRAPRDAALHLNLGTALFLRGDRDGAAAEFAEAATLSPGWARPRFALGVVESDRDRPAAAIEQLSKAIALDPSLADARFALAQSFRRARRFDEALTQLAAIVDADPNSSQARFAYAMTLVQMGRYRDARGALEDGVRAYPEQAGFAHALGRVLAAAPDAAVRDGAAALRLLEPLSRQSMGSAIAESMAMASAERDRFDVAQRWQRTAIERARREHRGAVIARMQATLADYAAGRPCRQPWRDDDPVLR